MLTANMDVKDGLVNGAVGVLEEIEYREVNTNDDARLWIELGGRTGCLTRLKAKPVIQAAYRRGVRIMAEWVPIEMRTFTITLDRKTGLAGRRKQFTAVQASAVTVHKSQGATDSSVVYGYYRKHPQKRVHVALSRCTYNWIAG
ncbi:hypothetical protein HPB49_016443 [Dermacentor silvarum]|uniref:Uncharacterized protein n=1 Tax=Dermacentor silvarum TaxID=543639 RepID=A0ACB8E1S8_DERSI|nr:hypothetical protein HPB49_016443 [Dermacentor silvarum]